MHKRHILSAITLAATLAFVGTMPAQTVPTTTVTATASKYTREFAPIIQHIVAVKPSTRASYLPMALEGKNVTIYCVESQDGITQEPSYSVTWAEGTYVDPSTGIRKNSQGDYLCAMGLPFGVCGDRFMITSATNQTFTVQIGDSKGDCWYHLYAEGTELEAYCVVEFIVDMDIAMQHVSDSGSYHTTDFFPGDIVRIERI